MEKTLMPILIIESDNSFKEFFGIMLKSIALPTFVKDYQTMRTALNNGRANFGAFIIKADVCYPSTGELLELVNFIKKKTKSPIIAIGAVPGTQMQERLLKKGCILSNMTNIRKTIRPISENHPQG